MLSARGMVGGTRLEVDFPVPSAVNDCESLKAKIASTLACVRDHPVCFRRPGSALFQRDTSHGIPPGGPRTPHRGKSHHGGQIRHENTSMGRMVGRLLIIGFRGPIIINYYDYQ